MSAWGADDHDDPAATAGGGNTAGEEPELYYGSVDEFVREYLRHVYKRRIDGLHRCWAGEWWRYDEAVIRLEALWRAWEHLRQDPATGMSIWFRDHADHHMPALMDPDGPFAQATDGEENTCKKGEALPYVSPPGGLFPIETGRDLCAAQETSHTSEQERTEYPPKRT